VKKIQIAVIVALGAAVIGLGIWTIVRRCQREAPTEPEEIARAVFGAVDDFDEEKQPWVECPLPTPDETVTVTFLRRHVHPFLAEFDRKLRFEQAGAEPVTRWLPTNVGGRTKINVYWYPRSEASGPFLKLVDHWGEYVADLTEKTISLIDYFDDVAYIGLLDDEDEGKTLGGGGYKGEEEWHVSMGKNKATKLTGPLAETGQYLGRLEAPRGRLQFLPASQTPEEKINQIAP